MKLFVSRHNPSRFPFVYTAFVLDRMRGMRNRIRRHNGGLSLHQLSSRLD